MAWTCNLLTHNVTKKLLELYNLGTVLIYFNKNYRFQWIWLYNLNINLKKGEFNLIFIYIIFSAILLYYVLKYGIRNGFAELEANKDNQDKKKLVSKHPTIDSSFFENN